MNAKYQTTIDVCAEIQRHAMESCVTAARVLGKVSLDVPVEQLPDALADMNAKFKPVRVGLANAEIANSMMELVRSEIEAIEQGALPFSQGGGAAAGTADDSDGEGGDDDDADDTTPEEKRIADAGPVKHPRAKKLRKMSTKKKGYRMARV